MRKIGWACCLLACVTSCPAVAQPRARQLEVPRTSAWQHAETGLVLSSTIAGLARNKIEDNGTSELDVLAEYESTDKSLIATVYLFRSQVPSVPLWFDRAKTVLESRKTSPVAAPGPAPVRAFALAAGGAETGLRVVYPVQDATYSATGLAVAPMKDWLVKVRMTAGSGDAAALDEKLAAFVSAIRWPAQSASASPAVPVEPCPEPLKLKRAKMIKPDMNQAVMGSFLATLASKGSSAAPAPAVYCRDPDQSVAHGVYRPDANSSAYVLALADSGRAVSVGAQTDIVNPKESRFSVTFLDLDKSLVFPSFNRLPPASQVTETLEKTRPLSSSSIGSSTVTIGIPTDR